jgi:hypothetical protein
MLLYYIIAAAIIWVGLGIWAWLFWCSHDRDVDIIDLWFCIFFGSILGVFSWLIGWFTFGRDIVIIKKRS